MNIEFSVDFSPGPLAWFMTKLRFEKRGSWHLWLGWWFYRPRYWRKWRFSYSKEQEDCWFVIIARCLGFEFVWESKKL